MTTPAYTGLPAHFAAPGSSAPGDSAAEGFSNAQSRSDHKHAREAVVNFAPTGAVQMYAGASAPTDWLLCDGSAVNRATYANLFSIIGIAYGAGDGSTTFNLPNLKGSVPVGYDASQTEFNALGKTGGAKTFALAVANLPAHAHDITHTHGTPATATGGVSASHAHQLSPNQTWANALGTGITTPVDSIARGAASGRYGAQFPNPTNLVGAQDTDHTHTLPGMTTNSQSTTSSGNGSGTATAFSVLQPYLALNYIIKT